MILACATFVSEGSIQNLNCNTLLVSGVLRGGPDGSRGPGDSRGD